MPATVTRGFRVVCRKCGKELISDSTANYLDPDSIERTAYFEPGASSPAMCFLVGTSEGSGDTFHCLYCKPVAFESDEE